MANGFTRAMRFEIVRSGWLKQKFRWRLRAANNEIICWSESYANEEDCKMSVRRVQGHAATAPIVNINGVVGV